MRIWKGLILAAWLVLSGAAMAEIEEVYTDAQAAEMAKVMIERATAMRAEVANLCIKASVNDLHEAAGSAKQALAAWRDDHLKYRALFPYHACRQAMVDVDALAMTCANGSYKGDIAQYDMRRWEEDSAACKAAIQSPDLTLKEF